MSKKIDTLPLGCMGNKQNELKLLLPIIDPQITDKTIFIEPFVGSCIVSFNVYKQINKNRTIRNKIFLFLYLITPWF